MMRSLIVLCLCVAVMEVAALNVTLQPDGSVRFGTGNDYALTPMAILPGWRSAQGSGDYEIKTPGVVNSCLKSDGVAIMDVRTTLEPLADGKAKVAYALTARTDVETLSLGCTIHLPSVAATGQIWCVDARKGAFARPANNGIVIAGGKGASFVFPVGPTVRLAASNVVEYLIQDNWRWDDSYLIRFGVTSRRKCKAGETFSLSFTVSADEPLVVADQRPYVIHAGAEWIPLAARRDILPGSALDFSHMGFSEAPAGKYGWIRNAGGHFEFENRPGRPQRFYGVNLCGTANFPDHVLADAMVTRFRRLGYNAIRLHHHDSGTVAGMEDGVTLSPKNMERFDYLLAAAIREGLYLTTDLFVSRAHVIKWRHIGVDRDGCVDMQLFKALCAVYDPAFENWAKYAKNFLLHENPYTGRRYIDEPAMSLLSLINEGGFFMGWQRGVRDDPRVLASWNAWLTAKRAADPSFAPGMSADVLPQNYWNGKTRPIVEQWTGELEAKMVARMKVYLRSLGCKALLTNDNCGSHYTARNGMDRDYDYIDDHFYVDHPSFLVRPWCLPSRCPNLNPLLGEKPIVPVEKDFPRVAGKPFTITEWNFSGPGRYRGVGGILTGATAAIKDWDGLWRFAYSHSRDNLGDTDMRGPGYFDLASDPLTLAGERACICLFLRGDIASGADGSLKIDRERGSFTIDTPRTVGGFTSEGKFVAGALRATVSGAPATVWVNSLDGRDVARSRRLLLTHLTDVQGDGAKFVDETMRVLLKWGKRPLVQNGMAEISLQLESPDAYEVWELAANGHRVRRVASDMIDGCLGFTASVKGLDGARMLYEITSDK